MLCNFDEVFMWKKCLLILCVSVSAHAVSLRSEDPVTFVDERTGAMEKPLVASSPNGDAILLVKTYSPLPRERGQNEILYVAFKEGDSPWAEPQILHQAKRISHVKAAADTNGLISFCWIEKRDDKENIYYGQKAKDDFWVAPFCQNFKGHKLQLLPSGEVIGIGDTDDMGDIVQTEKLIQYRFFNISPWDNNTSFNQQGDAVAIQKVSHWRNNTRWIKAAWYHDSKWTSPQYIHQESESPWGGYKALKGNDLTLVYWKHDDDLHLLTLWDGQTSSNKFPFHESYDVALGPHDEVYVVGQSQKDCLDLLFQDMNHEWHTISLPLSHPGKVDGVRVKVDARGNCLVAWGCRTKVWHNLQLNTRSVLYSAVFSGAKQQWSAPVLISSSHLSCYDVSISLAGEGHGFLAWVASNGRDQGVQVAQVVYEE
jgi:hypothetical protein